MTDSNNIPNDENIPEEENVDFSHDFFDESAPGEEEASDAEPEKETVKLSLVAVKQILEAMLFSSNEPISPQKLASFAGNVTTQVVTGLLRELQDEYTKRNSGLQIIEIAGGYQMATREHLSDWMAKLQRQRRRTILSPATLETLAIVAYKQPLTRTEIESIRGVDSSTPLRTLVNLGIVEVGGRKEVIGRPPLYITTDAFLKIFGLHTLADLPSISELKEMFAGQYSWYHQFNPDEYANDNESLQQGLPEHEPALFGLQPREDLSQAEDEEIDNADAETALLNNSDTDELFEEPTEEASEETQDNPPTAS